MQSYHVDTTNENAGKPKVFLPMFQKYNFGKFFYHQGVFIVYGSFWGADPLLHLPLLSGTPNPPLNYIHM